MRKPKFSRRLAFVILPFFYIVAALLSSIFIIVLVDTHRDYSKQANYKFAQTSAQTMDSWLKLIEQQVIMELDRDEKFQKFLYETESGTDDFQFLKTQLSQLFNEVVQFNPLIDSIYVYRDIDQTVLSSRSFRQIGEFGDKAFVSGLASESMTEQWSSVRTYNEYYPLLEYRVDGQNVKVISYVRKVPLFMSRNGLLVININVNRLEALLRDNAGDSVGYVRMVDSEGQVIAATTNIPAEAKAVSKVNSSVPGYFYESGWTSKDMSEEIYSFLNMWMAAGVAGVLAISAGMLWLLRRFAHPIDSLINRLTSKRQFNRLDFEYLDNLMDELIHQAGEYHFASNQYHDITRKQWFRELLNGERVITEEDWNANAYEEGSPQQWTASRVMVVEIDYYKDFQDQYSSNDQSLFKFAIEQVVKETSAENNLRIWTTWLSSDQLTVIVQGDPLAQAQNIKQWVKLHLPFTVSIGISGLSGEPRQIAEAREEALELLSYKATQGIDRVFTAIPAGEGAPLEILNIIEMTSQAAYSLRMGSADWRAQMMQVFDTIEQSVTSRSSLLTLFQYMNFCLSKVIQEGPESYRDAFNKDVEPRLIGLLDRFETIQEYRDGWMKAASALEGELEELRSGNHKYELFKQIEQYMKECFHDPDLSLAKIAEHFCLSNSHMSRLIKEATGSSWTDYVTELRVRHAKILLSTTNKSIQEIGLECGYLHGVSFGRVFKKQVGFAPGDYRKQAVLKKGTAM
ncbi:AraC family transcriptional regulator [Paenibacillus sp. HB172176]|uniref:AraC family transcriptional regulator n=1 Tax=Paenibacillus sp. HB172176 TaxID=2493690 RepID=UPI00143A84A5|nr:AraC family transcriptional regulator [Paenibacillus sp. HB172176]